MWNDPEQYPLTYGYQVDYTKEAKVIAKYIEENFPTPRSPTTTRTTTGSDSIAGLDQYLADKVVADEGYESTAPDAVGGQIASFKEAKVHRGLRPHPGLAALGILNAVGQGYHPQWVISSIGSDIPLPCAACSRSTPTTTSCRSTRSSTASSPAATCPR